jgi:hypothetical protein
MTTKGLGLGLGLGLVRVRISVKVSVRIRVRVRYSRSTPFFVLYKFLHKLCFMGIRKRLTRRRGPVCSPGDAVDLLKKMCLLN